MPVQTSFFHVLRKQADPTTTSSHSARAVYVLAVLVVAERANFFNRFSNHLGGIMVEADVTAFAIKSVFRESFVIDFLNGNRVDDGDEPYGGGEEERWEAHFAAIAEAELKFEG
jgi:hypothetical protein